MITKMTSILVLMTILLIGCGQTVPEPSPEPPVAPQVSPEPSVTPPTTQVPTLFPPPSPEPETPIARPSIGWSSKFSISKPPSVGETVELTFTLNYTGGPQLLNPPSKVWLEFERYDPALYYPLGRGTEKDRRIAMLSRQTAADSPYSYLKRAVESQPASLVPAKEVVISGNTTWQGQPLKRGDQVKFAMTVRFPQEGEWWIAARWQADGEPPLFRDELYLTVLKDAGTVNWPKDYSQGNTGYRPALELWPEGFYIKTERVPLVAEPMALLVSIQSIKDMDAAEAFLEFRDWTRRVEVPNRDLIVSGQGSWKGALKKGVPVEFSCVLKFPTEGDWQISFLTGARKGGTDRDRYRMYFHVGKDNSHFGWPVNHFLPTLEQHPPGRQPSPGATPKPASGSSSLFNITFPSILTFSLNG